jgi:hypothetical protein
MTSERVPEQSTPRHHWAIMAICAGVVLLSLLLEVHADGRVALRTLGAYPLPELCGCRVLFGIPCPGCGLTRSFIHLAHGRWMEAWHTHRLGWLLAGTVLIQFPYRMAALRWPERGRLDPRIPRWFGAALIVLLIVNWIWQI